MKPRMRDPSRLALFVIAALCAGALTACGFGDEDPEPPRPDTNAGQQGAQQPGGAPTRIAEVYRRVEPSVVSVRVRGAVGGGEGSGVARGTGRRPRPAIGNPLGSGEIAASVWIGLISAGVVPPEDRRRAG